LLLPPPPPPPPLLLLLPPPPPPPHGVFAIDQDTSSNIYVDSIDIYGERKRHLLRCHLYMKPITFTKTGSGQT
jgi:hypothetical protein